MTNAKVMYVEATYIPMHKDKNDNPGEEAPKSCWGNAFAMVQGWE